MYSLKEFKKNFDPILEKFLKNKLESFNSLTTDEFIRDFVSHTNKLFIGGKRLRPYLAYFMYKAYGGKYDWKAMQLFVTLEIFHLFALVHDDIMDKASIRRGEKTVNKYIYDNIRGFGDLKHIANSQAILVGDLLMSWSMDNFINIGFEQNNFDKAREYLYKMIDEVILGQMLDVDISTKEMPEKKLIDEKTRLKTSRYTCVRPMQIGASLADINYNQEEFLEELGTKVGIAFQMQDDLLALIGSEKSLTKDILIDVEEHQHTFYTNFIFENATHSQKEEFKRYFGKKLSKEEKENAKNLFIKSGAIDAGKKEIIKMLTIARELIANSSLKREFKKGMNDLLDIMERRQS
jgi:geranylgeranyl diphosphate synthase type I